MNGEMNLSIGRLILYIAVMAVVTYLIRMIPFTLFRKEIKSTFFRSFLAYVPYAVLGAMTFPSIFYATASLPSAIAGTRDRTIISAMAFISSFAMDLASALTS